MYIARFGRFAMYVRTGIDAYIAVQGEHLGIPENKRTKFVRLFSHIYRELLLYKIKWTFCPHLLQPFEVSLGKAVALVILFSATKAELSP